MADEGSGRARGKARGRARGQQAAGDQATRRPGGEPVQERAAPAAGHPGPNGAGGRRTHRGAPRVDPVGPERVEAITEAMAAAAVSSEMGGRGRSRRGMDGGDDNTRPAHCQDKRGSSGTGIALYANFFEVLSKPTWCVFQYHCEFSPVVESSRMRRSFMREHKEKFGDCYIFDGMSDLKTVTQLGEGAEFFSQRRTDGENIRITVKRVAELAPNHPELGRLFNTQMRRNLQHLKFQLLGRHYFDQNAVSDVQQYNLQIWQGVITSIRQQEEKLMLSVETTHKVVRKETALEIIKNIVSQAGPEYKEIVARDLVGAIVMTRYNNRTYRIEDIDWNLNPTKTFESKEGPLEYETYYKRQYDIEIRDKKQPLLFCTSKEREVQKGAVESKKIYLIPELCCMTGLTDSMRNNFQLMKELANHTKLDPATRVRNLNTFIRRVNQNENVASDMKAWGLKFDDNLVRFQGRVVPPEDIIMRGGKASYDQKSGDFTREMRGKPMYSSVNLENWVLICTKFDEPKANDFLSNLYKVGPPMGMRISPPQVVVIQVDRINNFLQAYRENVRSGAQLVCFIVPNNKKERYDALKKHTYLDNALASQVIVARTLSKKPMLMSVATKVAVQMNCKLGGEPWAMTIPFKVPLMIIGYDTYHDSSKKGRSAGAFVASLNQNCTKWYSRVSFHSAGGWHELSDHLKVNFTAALKKFYEINKTVPELILFYRDGVGDGQIRYVREWEVKQFVGVINETIGQQRGTRYAFIVVNKRVNAKFFAQAGNSYSNPPPGTVIDNTVTRPDRYDFFLVSQSVRQGTVGPTMYNVIEDTSNLKPEYIQRLSYKMTHLYYNCQGTIKVPAPCQYAHKLAFLAGQSLHQAPREELSDTLYYL
ncbi:piwi-like protein 1 [Uloborus diversus]|uniref:piwi-like protein 1 n=1 Tax=Uloborus diversus TaxID=327109 RepID=UPI00240A0C91|nr:piwi-like protein 1 [Uloborus diversus]